MDMVFPWQPHEESDDLFRDSICSFPFSHILWNNIDLCLWPSWTERPPSWSSSSSSSVNWPEAVWSLTRQSTTQQAQVGKTLSFPPICLLWFRVRFFLFGSINIRYIFTHPNNGMISTRAFNFIIYLLSLSSWQALPPLKMLRHLSQSGPKSNKYILKIW